MTHGSLNKGWGLGLIYFESLLKNIHVLSLVGTLGVIKGSMI